jgi:hypothetical protein
MIPTLLFEFKMDPAIKAIEGQLGTHLNTVKDKFSPAKIFATFQIGKFWVPGWPLEPLGKPRAFALMQPTPVSLQWVIKNYFPVENRITEEKAVREDLNRS